MKDFKSNDKDKGKDYCYPTRRKADEILIRKKILFTADNPLLWD